VQWTDFDEKWPLNNMVTRRKCLSKIWKIFGAPKGGRLAKYSQLLSIEEELGNRAVFRKELRW